MPKPKTTHFGYQTVPEEQKQSRVNDVFTGVAWRYDLMNDAMSLGIHHDWKNTLIQKLSPTAAMHLLDLAGGSGDITRRFLKKGGGKATLSDINEAMLEQGRRRLTDSGLASRVEFLLANAESLPCKESSFDAVTIAFGIRNVTHIDKVLSEAHRVLKPGGQFLCLEFSPPEESAFGKLYDAYSFRVIPKLGKLLVGDEASYQYLVESIRKFPDKKTFAEMLTAAGLTHTEITPLTGGIVAIHTGWKC